MTWAEFVKRVEAEIIDHGFDRDKTPILFVNWDALAFGGPTPDIYINELEHDGVRVMGIGED